MKQPIFYIKKTNLDRIFLHFRENGVIPHPTDMFTWGKFKSKEEFLNVIDSLPVDADGEILLSDIQQRLNEFFTEKLAVNANNMLKFYMRQITAHRQEKNTPGLWKLRKRQ